LIGSPYVPTTLPMMGNMSTPRVRSVEWPDVRDWVNKLAKVQIDYDSIVGVSRGGIPPAVCLSYLHHDRPLYFAYRNEPPGVKEPFYVFGAGRERRLAENRSSYRITDGFKSRHPLVVDDVVTFGDTLSVVADLLEALGAQEITFATYAADVGVLQRERPSVMARLNYRESIDNAQVWLSFPWHVDREG
jgi:hypoxanthine phosphoribosyltransferase